MRCLRNINVFKRLKMMVKLCLNVTATNERVEGYFGTRNSAIPIVTLYENTRRREPHQQQDTCSKNH